MCLMMEKNKNILIILSVGIILIVSIFFVLNKSHEYHELPKVKIKESVKNKQFALMLEQENGEYKESTGEFPTEGYVFNENKSDCTDINGKIIDGALNYDYETYTVLVDTSKTSYCYLYYDIEPNISNLRKNDSGNYLSKNLQGGMYRYQGIYTDDIRNYICLGDNCCNTTECDADSNDDMYRIIGINAKGELKVIKKTALSDGLQWWNDRNIVTNWPQSLAYQKLNGKSEGSTNPNLEDSNSYYYSLDNNLKKLIIKNHSWLYGDTIKDGGYNGALIYGIESGNSETIYYNQEDIEGYPTGKSNWNERIEAPMGLMYMSDYYYAYKTNDLDAGNPGNKENATKSWLFINHNQLTNNYEWTMTRYGLWIPGIYYCAWFVYTDGNMANNRISIEGAGRPTFYLSSETKLSGEGTLSNPFKINLN